MTSISLAAARRWLARLCGDDVNRCLKLAAAFAAVYVVWGSTYLAIRVAIETIPPFAMAGVRFVLAGGLLYGWQRLRGTPAPLRIHWRSAAIIGALLLLGGNGGVTWAEQEVPSGLAALIIATVPIWVVVFGALRPGTPRPNRRTLVGVLLGLVGITLLVGPSNLAVNQQIRTISYVVLLLAPVSWALGSLYSRGARLPASQLQATGMEMLLGGGLLLLAATVTGEWARLDVSAISLRSAVAFLYLVFIGAIIGFTAYIWLLKNTTPAKATTYAYVNPVVAVFLGWAILSEPVTPAMLAAMVIILFSVALISGVTLHRRPAAP
jgi:drug/metabolite transporter (DMT)-like permease